MARIIKTLKDVKEAGLVLVATCHNVNCRRRQPVDLDSVIFHVGALHPIMPTKGVVHFSERMRCPTCEQRGMHIWTDVPGDNEPLFEGKPKYKIQAVNPTTGTISHIIGLFSHPAIIEPAIVAAAAVYPKYRIELLDGSRVMRTSHLRLVK